MKIKELICYAVQLLKENNVEDYNIKARLLLQHVLKQNSSYLLINADNEVDNTYIEKYKKYLLELIQGKPIQYITHNQEFMNLNFYVDENVLIPQPDTEILVEEVLKKIKEKMKYGCENLKVLDLCTGSGAIAISIAKYVKKLNTNIEVYASDISKEALNVAKKNAKNNDVMIKFILSDMFEKIKDMPNMKFDIIVSNPPYIEKENIKKLPLDVQNEPFIALNGGDDGLEFYKIIAKEGKQFLNENGSIFLEIGYCQKESVTQLFKCDFKDIICLKDLAGNDRVIKMENK